MTTEVADWKKALQESAAKIQVAEQGAGGTPFLSFRSGVMTIHEKQVPNGMLECVVIASITERTMYDRAYDPDDKAPPECFAQGDDPKQLIAHENVKEPIHGTCKGCPKAEFGTARQGKGPACKTYRKLALLAVGGPMADAELAWCRIPPTSVANWSKYASAVAAQGLPPWAVGTIVKVAPHPKKQFEVTFETTGPLANGEDMAVIHGRIEEAERALYVPYEYEEATKY